MKLEKEFSDFICMKYSFDNSCMYEYTVSGTAKMMQCSRSKIARLVKMFIRLGWCSMRQERGYQNLMFKKFCEIHKMYFDKANFSKRIKLKLRDNNPREILLQLSKVLLSNKQAQMQYMINLKRDLTNPAGKFARVIFNDAKKILRRKRYNVSGEISERLLLSHIAFGKFLNRSASTAGRRLNQLIKNKQVTYKRNKKLLFTGKTQEFLRNLQRYHGSGKLFISMGNIYLKKSHSYKLQEDPDAG